MLAWQMIRAVEQAHAAGVCHGDLKLENFLVTSWGLVLLADLAPYKPPTLPADTPAPFSLFFDAGSRRRCYLAPERFVTTDAVPTQDAVPVLLSRSRPAAQRPSRPVTVELTPAMDVFALGELSGVWYSAGKGREMYGSLNPYTNLAAQVVA